MLSLQDLCHEGAIDPEKVLGHMEAGLSDKLLELDIELSTRTRSAKIQFAVACHGTLTGKNRRGAARKPAPLVARLVSLFKPAQEQQPPESGCCLPETAFQAIRRLVQQGASLEKAALALQPFRCGALSCHGICPGRSWHVEARARLLELMRIAHGAGRGGEVFLAWDSNDILEVVLCRSCTEEMAWLHLCGVRPHATLHIVADKLQKLTEKQEEEMPDLFALSRWHDFDDFMEPDYATLEINVLEHCLMQRQAWRVHVDSCSWRVLIERDFRGLSNAAGLLWKFVCGECNCFICEHFRRVKAPPHEVVSSKPSSQHHMGPCSESSVIEAVHHLDPPAVIDPDVARDAVGVAWADQVGTDVASVDQAVMPLTNEGEPSEDSDALFLLQFKRHPCVLRDTLLGSHALLQCRHGLTDHGYSYELPSQALVFVHACQYREVMAMIAGQNLKQSHVLVSNSILYLVEEALSTIPSRQRPSRSQVVVGVMETHFLIGVKRTLIGVIPRHLAPSEVTQSTTEAHGAFNPRRQTSMHDASL